jgi:hypothetical protein
MKNIHMLPTENSSRLYLYKSIELFLHPTIVDANVSNLHCQNQNIYITNDEEIKKGDWCLHNGILKRVLHIRYSGAIIVFNVGNGSIYGHKFKNAKKIILTTDKDLIKDGVQAIDDEFLKWFVKNPSCEFVEINKYAYAKPNFGNYKIIIPKEEPKQEMPWLPKEVWDRHHQLKQETLEEVNDNRKNLYFKKQVMNPYAVEEYSHTAYEKGFIEGYEESTKWQAERMYSEEDLREAFRQGQDNMDYSDTYGWYSKLTEQEWFEQFKKK